MIDENDDEIEKLTFYRLLQVAQYVFIRGQ